MRFILGKKIGVSQIFDEKGSAIPVTLVEAGPVKVIQIKNQEKDGYGAAQVGFGEKKKINKSLKGHLKDLGNFKYLKEFRTVDPLKVGDEINVSIFKEGDLIKVAGISKGKGFAGVVKRYGFKGGPASHGQKDRLRAPGSIGMSFPERVPKGRRMAGRAGTRRVTIKNLKVMKVIVNDNLLVLKGAVPGIKGSLLEIYA